MSGIPLPCYLRGFRMSGIALPCYLRGFQACPEFRFHAICEVFACPEFRFHAICEVFKRVRPATEAPGVPDVLHLYYKSRLSSHGSSGSYKVDFPATQAPGASVAYYVCTTKKSTFQPRKPRERPRRTTFVLQKSTFQPRKLRASPAYYVCTTEVGFPATEAPGVRGVLRLYYKKSSAQPRKLRVSPAYYVCILQKVDFPARGVLHLYYKSRLSSHGSSGRPRRTTFVLQKWTFQPRVRGVLRLYYNSRLSSHGGSACPWRTTFVLQNSIFQPRKSSAYYVCTTQVEKKTHKTQNHYGFSTTTMRKPAEGLRLYVRKRKNTRVLAPRQRRNPQRGYVCMSENAKTRWFWHRANAQTRRGLSAGTKKVPKTTALAMPPGDHPQRVVRACQET